MKSCLFALLMAAALVAPAGAAEVVRDAREQIRKAEAHHILLFDRSRAERLHADEYFQKPVDFELLLSAVRSHCHD